MSLFARFPGRARRFLSPLVGLALALASPAAEAVPTYRRAAVATQHALASEAALEMLGKGGNAVDAAVAAAFTLAVVGPYHSGLGGGGFALVFEAKGAKTSVLDFREVAPQGATRDMFVRDGRAVPELSTDGALSVAVPGAPRGYLELLARFGKLKPATVLAPAIRAAEKGFAVTPKYVALAAERKACLQRDPEAARLFLRGGEVPPLGARLVQKDLAKTLRTLAQRGAKAFYQGPLAQALAQGVQQSGGLLTAADLARYEPRWRAPLEGSYRGHKVLTMPPPSAGGLAVLQALKALELAGPAGLPSRDPEVLHLFIEMVRRTYVDRAKRLGDPAFTRIPLEELASEAYVAKQVASIDRAKATPSQSLLASPAAVGGAMPVAAPDAGLNRKNTTHLSVVDAAGNAVALTTTLNMGFGACLVAQGTGVLLNDEMDDFAAMPLTPNGFGLVTGEANAIAPGKIPLSSMSPTLVFQKADPTQVMLAVGSPGGSTIPTTVAQVISNVIDGPMDVVRAVGAGRLHHQYMPDAILVDRYGLEPLTQRALEAKGHKVQRAEGWGDAEAVFVDPATGLRSAGSDPRNEGAGLGQD